MVSIIVCIYNVLKFIDRGVSNVLAQSYTDFELLLVDDGSTDGSLHRCQAWAARDRRIRVFHQDNQGSGSARNLGLENARGEYICFYDVDDEIPPGLLAYNVEQMTQRGVDVVVFGYNNIDYKTGYVTPVRFGETKIENNEDLRSVFVDEFALKTNGFVWNKCYRKCFLDRFGLRFENQRIQQDEVFNLLVYEHLEKAYISSEILYTYYVYQSGNTRSRFIVDRFDIYKSVYLHFARLRDFWKLNDERFDHYILERFYNDAMQCMLFNLTHPQCPWSTDEKRHELQRVMSDTLTKQSFSYAAQRVTGIEQRLYRRVCRKQSLWRIRFYTELFRLLRCVKHCCINNANVK